MAYPRPVSQFDRLRRGRRGGHSADTEARPRTARVYRMLVAGAAVRAALTCGLAGRRRFLFRCPAAVIESKRLQREGTACAAIPLSSNGRAAVPLPMSDCFYVRHLWSPRAPAKRCSELAVAAEVRAREARGSGSRRGKSAPTGRSDGGRRRDRLRIRVPHAASSSSWAGKAQAERSAPNDGACSAHDGTSRRRGTRAGHRDASGERGSGHARTAPALGGRGASRARLRALTRPRLRVRVVDRRPIGQSASTGAFVCEQR
jgi:hypothetical protein